MNRKVIVICSIVAAVLILGIAVAVMFLYSGSENVSPKERLVKVRKNKTEIVEIRFEEALQAIPIDAIAVAVLSDASSVATVLPPEVASSKWGHFISSLVDSQVVSSLHYNGAIQPLAVLEGDNALQNRAVREGLMCGNVKVGGKDFILISSSESLVSSSLRHVSLGQSVLDVEPFAEAYRKSTGNDVILLSHQYSDKILMAYFGKEVARNSTFVSKVAMWTYFVIEERTPMKLALTGGFQFSSSPQFYANVLSNTTPSDISLGAVVPMSVDYVVDIPFRDVGAYVESYRKYLDATGKLSQYDSGLGDALVWADRVGLKEAAIVRWSGWKGEEYEAVFVRTKTKGKQKEPGTYDGSGYLAALLGPVFKLKDESSFVCEDDWTVSGSADAVADWLSSYRGNEQMLIKECSFLVYSKPRIMVYSGGVLKFIEDNGDIVKNTSVQVSKGPFEVTNCATGKKNSFYQNESLYLCLKDETGKSMWGVPFQTPICGRAQDVDIYKNDKIQFLFASGSQLYLIDRLGRFVSGFPVNLGKDVLLGPDVYDFDGDKEYKVMVLHTDNTLEMYDLKGDRIPSWKGIKPEVPVLDLPELETVNGESVWKVTTITGTVTYPFEGGEAVKDNKKN